MKKFYNHGARFVSNIVRKSEGRYSYDVAPNLTAHVP